MLGSGEDLMSGASCARSDQCPIEVVDASADVRGRIEPLTWPARGDLVTRNSFEAAVRLGPGFSVLGFTLEALLRDHSGNRWSLAMLARVASGRLEESPAGCDRTTVPVDDDASCC